MKVLLYLIIPFTFLTYTTQPKAPTCKNAQYILEQSIKLHDPEGTWKITQFNMLIREPRLSNPERFSNVALDMRTGRFSLERNRGEHISTHHIDADGVPLTLLNDMIETDPELIKTYRLEAIRNTNYRSYYEFMYGLPMILDSDDFQLKNVENTDFNGQKVLSMDFEMKTPIIASSWRVFFSPKDYTLVGIETLGDTPEKGEYLVFDGLIQLQKLQLARFRHWYNKTNDEYLGSDILLSNKKR